MRIKLRTLLLLLPFAAASCSDVLEEGPRPAGTINVTVGSDPGIGIQSRTALENDGETVRWIEGDKIALWAVNAEGATPLSAHPFRMYHYNATFNAAKFTADIPAMSEGKYDYYAASPVPVSTNGRMAAFALPAEQTVTPSAVGEPVKIPVDIMVSAPVMGADALTSGDNSDKVNFIFKHKTHVLKIRIPENRMGMPISALELTFPQPVVGTLTVDTSDPTAPPTLSDGENTVLLNFTKPVDAGMVVCASIAPVALTSADEIVIKAYTATKESVPAKMSGKAFAEAHTTPIALTIPEIYRATIIDFSLDGDGTSTLGEKVNSITLTAPAGTDLGEGINTRTFTVNDNNKYSLIYEGEFTDNLSGKELIVSYDSESAIVSNKFTVPQLTADERNVMNALPVPYLFMEDFGNIPSFNYHSEWSGGDNKDHGGTSLTGWGLTDWTGARIGGSANTSIRIACHVISVFGSAGRRPGRVDTCPLTVIKPGKTPAVSVSYTYSAFLYEGVGSGGDIRLSAGYTEKAGAMDGPEKISNIVIPESALAVDGKTGDDRYDTANMHANSFLIQSCTSATRLSWRVYSNRGGTGNGNYWVYLDNIKVQIVK